MHQDDTGCMYVEPIAIASYIYYYNLANINFIPCIFMLSDSVQLHVITSGLKVGRMTRTIFGVKPAYYLKHVMYKDFVFKKSVQG